MSTWGRPVSPHTPDTVKVVPCKSPSTRRRSSALTAHVARRPGLTLGILSIAAISYVLQQTLVVPALPTIQRDLDTSTTWVTWVFTGFLLTSAVATPLLGKLGDIHGKRMLLVISMLIFVVGTVAAALVELDRDARGGARPPGGGRRDLPALVRDHPRRVPAREGGRGPRAAVGDVRRRGRRSAWSSPA